MPSNDKTGAVLRQWAVIQCLTSSNQTTQQIHRLLETRFGIYVKENTVLRDLKTLHDAGLAIDRIEAKPLNWKLKKEFAARLGRMSEAEALMVVMAADHLRQALPFHLGDSLQTVVNQARDMLDRPRYKRLSGQIQAQWLEKVRVVSPQQPQIPPTVDEDVRQRMIDALLNEYPVSVIYKGVKLKRLSPLALVVRGGALYLAAARDDEPEVKRFALHRFESVEPLLTKAFVRPVDFDIDDLLRHGWADFQSEGDGDVSLVLWCRRELKNHLWEMRLSENQWITPVQVTEGWYKVTANLPCTWQLRGWLLSQGESVQVREPYWLREEIKASLKAAAGVYDGDE